MKLWTAWGVLAVLVLCGCAPQKSLEGAWKGPTTPVPVNFTMTGDKVSFTVNVMGASLAYEGTGKYDHSANRLTLEGMKANAPAIPDFMKNQLAQAFPEKGTVAVVWKNDKEVTLTFEGAAVSPFNGAYAKAETP